VRTFVAVLAAALLATTATLAQNSDAPHSLTVTARALESFDTRDATRVRFGSLEFRGGLVLKSTDKDFGGLSGLTISPDGQSILAISDHGYWFRARLNYASGRMTSLSDAEIGAILGADGKPLYQRGWYDVESVTEWNGKHCVGIERVNEVVCLDFRKDGMLARGQPIVTMPFVKTLPRNQGLEALAGIPAGQELGGALLLISERGLDQDGNFLAGMIGGPRPGPFTVKRIPPFDNTDATVMPDGDVLLLERRFSILGGLGMRIRRLKQSAIKPGALVDGPVLIEADGAQEIDNMEGIAVHRAANGETIVTIISDDNFLMIQRTVLLQFAVVE
jgi:hypothetical protein